MSELFETIDNNAAEAKIRAQAEAEAVQKAQENMLARKAEAYKQAAQARHTKAKKAIILRAAVCILIALGLWVATSWELIDVRLSRALVAAVACYLTFWLGAWFQFRFCKGGLLE